MMIDPEMFWLVMGTMLAAGIIVGATGAMILVSRGSGF
jgi:hypothetical protein